MSFTEYLKELLEKGKILLIAGILFLIPLLAFWLAIETTYNNPSLKWISTILGYLSIPAIILFLIIMGYYGWKYKSKQRESEEARGGMVVIREEKREPYYIGSGVLTETAQEEIPKDRNGVIDRKDTFGLKKWGFSKRTKK